MALFGTVYFRGCCKLLRWYWNSSKWMLCHATLHSLFLWRISNIFGTWDLCQWSPAGSRRIWV